MIAMTKKGAAMQFLYSLLFIATLFTSLQAMIPEEIGHEVEEAAAEKARTALAAEQSLINTYRPIFESTILSGLPAEIKTQTLQALSKATSITEVEYYLEDLSNKHKSMRAYTETPEFKTRWLQFVQQIGAKEIKKASEARDLLRTQQKAATQTKPSKPQEKGWGIEKLPQFDASTIFGNLFKGVLPDEVIAIILPQIYNASSIEEVGNILHRLSLSSATIRRYLNTPQFTEQWSRFSGRARAYETEESIKDNASEQQYFKSQMEKRKSAPHGRPAYADEILGTNYALDSGIRAASTLKDHKDLSDRASAALTFITSTAAERNLLNINGHKFTVPLLARLLKTRTFNPNQLLEFREIVNGNIQTITQLPLTYVLRRNGPASLVKDLLNAGARANGDIPSGIDSAMEKPINKNTLKNIQLLIAAKADVTKISKATISNLLYSGDPTSIQILGTLLEHHAPITPAHITLANKLLADAVEKLPATDPARVELQLKANLVNHYASAITRARAQVGL
jgi:hypothetical protein